ncbi:unnamed protein product [Discula destructiva]
MAAVNARYVVPHGVGLAIAIISPTLLLCSISAVVVRVHVRRSEGTFAIDDALLMGGLITYIVDTCLAVYSVTVGVGAFNSRLNSWMMVEAEKYYIIWILLYVIGLAQIKSSICVMIWRIGNQRKAVRVTLYFLLGLVWASFLVTFVGVLLFCSPIEANWNTSLLQTDPNARCGTMKAMIGISHTATVTTIITDTGAAILPGVLLWKTNMKSQTKFEIFTLMSVASLASISTIARAPYISHYEEPENNLLYYIGYIVLFSNIETGIGCVASSLPAIRRLHQRRNVERQDWPTSLQSPSHGNDKTFVTIGGGVVGSRGYTLPKAKLNTHPPRKSIPSLPNADRAHGAGLWRLLKNDDSAVHWNAKGARFAATDIAGTDSERAQTIEMEPMVGNLNASSLALDETMAKCDQPEQPAAADGRS